MNLRNFFIAVCIVVVAGLVYVWHTGSSPSTTKTLDAAPSVTWMFVEEAPAGPETAPKMKVALRTNDVVKNVGVYDGVCFDAQGSNWELIPNEIAAAICYWAGGGTEIGVFEENGAYVVKEGVLEESTGETEGLRGSFKTLFAL